MWHDPHILHFQRFPPHRNTEIEMLTHWGGLECQTRALLTLLHSFNHLFRKCPYLSTLLVGIVLVHYYMLWWLAALSMRWCTGEMRRHSVVRQRPKTTKHKNIKKKSDGVRQSFFQKERSRQPLSIKTELAWHQEAWLINNRQIWPCKSPWRLTSSIYAPFPGMEDGFICKFVKN